MKIKLLPISFVLALVSTGEATLKTYPFFFSVFIFIYMLSGLRPQKALVIPVLAFVSTAILFSLIHVGTSYDAVSMIKLILNFSFFVFAGSYVLSLPVERSANLLRQSAVAFLSLSFLQIFYIVYAGSLWLLPVRLGDSTSAYVIQQSAVFFGDLNKNLWASKVSIFLMIFCCCQHLSKRAGFYFSFPFALGLFSLIYISSRTAQLAFLIFVAALFYYNFWILKKQRAVLVLLSIIFVPACMYFFDYILRIDYETLRNFRPELNAHMGDGLLSRLIIWAHVFHSTQVSDYLFGNGILSFSYYTGGVFSENNPHNIFLSILLDFGLLAICLYIFLLRKIFYGSALSLLLILPFLVFANSQYLGYDSDLMVFFLLVLLARSSVDNLNSNKTSNTTRFINS